VNGRDHGFTLIETLATLGIAGLVSVLLLGSLGFSGGAWTRSVALADASSDIYAAQTALRRLALDFTNGTGGARFAGNVQSLAMTTRFAFPGAIPAPTQAALALDTCDDKPCLVLTLSRSAPAGASATAVRTPLVRDIAGARFSYLSSAGVWTDAWREQDGAPRLVRVELQFAARDPRRWPPLYLALGAS
jgi:general secretion pathway protein J